MGKVTVRKKVSFMRTDWDIVYYEDIFYGDGFDITEPAEVSLDGTKKKSLHGPQSPLYGTNYEDEQAFIERYRCECGRFKGRQFMGEICPYCKQPVEARDSNINVTGWLTLAKSIINPYYFHLLSQTIGQDIFPDIIYSAHKVNKNGIRTQAVADDYDEVPLSPFSGIGVDGFYKRYDEIMEYFKKKKKAKASTIDILLDEKHKVFTKHIPIPSTLLRPQSVSGDTFYFNTVDKLINTAFSLTESLRGCEEAEEDDILKRLQLKANSMWNTYFDELNGKEGFIRGTILGGSMNFTARNVIIPDPTLKDNEIDLSYHTFLELFKYRIIYYLMRLDDISLSKATSIWNRASNFDEKVYEIMQLIVENDKSKVFINRNPTLNFYSMLLMNIRQIKHDGSDYTLSVPLSILAGLNADFDGDILNILGITDSAFAYILRKFNPIERMIISRTDGTINEYFTITKGQLIDVNYFCTIGKKENDEEQTYPVRTNDTSEIIYVPKSEVKKYKSGILKYEEVYG